MKKDVEFISAKRETSTVDCPTCAPSSSRRRRKKNFSFSRKFSHQQFSKRFLQLEGKYYLKKAFDEQLNRYFGTKTSFSKASNKIFRALNDSIKRLALKSSEKGTVLVVTKYKVISDLQKLAA